MALKDIFQTDTEQVAEFPVPAGVYPGADGAVVVLRIPTPRESLDLSGRNLSDLEAEEEGMKLMLKEIRLEGETLDGGDIDVGKLPAPLWRFISTCANGVAMHGRQQAGEALRGWRNLQSAPDG